MTPPQQQFSELLAFARLGARTRTAQRAFFRAQKERRYKDGEQLLAAARREEATFDNVIEAISRRPQSAELKRLVHLAVTMRAAQREFFSRSRHSGIPGASRELLAAKRAERNFEKLLKEVLALEQGSLFGTDDEDGPEGGAN